MFWNEGNQLVQCHHCGQVWQPKPAELPTPPADLAAVELRIVVTQPEAKAVRTQIKLRTVGVVNGPVAEHVLKIKDVLTRFLTGMPGHDLERYLEQLFIKRFPNRGERPGNG